MALKFVAFVACLGLVRASGPAAYEIATASGDLGSIGYSQESTQKGYAGQNVISAYSRGEDSAHSSVRVSSHSISNDGLLNYNIAHEPLIAKSYAAPYSYAASAPLLTKTYAAPLSYAAPAPLLAKSYAAPYSYAAPSPLLAKSYAAPYSYAASAPLLTKSYAAPLSYAAPASLLTKAYAAPATSFLTKSYLQPSAPLLAKSYLAPSASLAYPAQLPLIAKSGLIAHGDPYSASIASAPLLTKTYAPSIIAKSASLYDYAPQVISKTLVPSGTISHTVFNGIGANYACSYFVANFDDDFVKKLSICCKYGSIETKD
ncbi:cuticle protein 21.3-like [Colletes gigas]|uniref:cuticle protein 21.3-like n=1 Tax=Colletes gigas TaxID=935657 RepID=UPI001C9B4C56|nr:cuticle protein 21.3-like [Colletes gigas]